MHLLPHYFSKSESLNRGFGFFRKSAKRHILLKVDIDVPKVRWANGRNEFYEELPDAIISQNGAFVLLNSDDDDYSGLPDKDDINGQGEPSSIVGPNGEIAETDLLPVTISPLSISSSILKIVLDVPEGLRVWKNENRSDRVYGKNDNNGSGPTELDANIENILYLEGTIIGEVILKMDLMNLGEALFTDHELLKVTVFDIEGPTSVPAKGTYQYEAVGAEGEWGTPEHGLLGQPEGGDSESLREVLWDFVPFFDGETGVVNFAPLVDAMWGREVDIVSLELAEDDQDGENEIRSKNPGTGWEVIGMNWDNTPFSNPDSPGDDEPIVIRSSNGGPHVLRAWIQALGARGPTRAGIEHRGVDRLKFGFVQRGKWAVKRSIYPSQIRVSSLEGMDWHLDCYLPEPPWIEDRSYTLGTSFISNRRSLYQHDSNEEITDSELAFHYEFVRGDTFADSGARAGMMLSDIYEINGEKPTDFEIEGLFDLNLVVTADSGIEEADTRYYRLANLPNVWRYSVWGRIINDQIVAGTDGNRWGAYSGATFVVRNLSFSSDLQQVTDFNDTYLIVKEYPYLDINGGDDYEPWSSQ